MNENDKLILVDELDAVLRSKDKVSHVMNNGKLKINRGSTIGIVGESGSGKTQLFKTISGTQDMTPGITSGTVIYYLEDSEESLYIQKADKSFILSDRHKEIKRDIIGFIPQDPKSFLNPYWTLEKIFYQTYKMKNREIDFDDFIKYYLEQVDIDSSVYKKKLPDQLSGGEAQRVMIALVLSKEPQLIIADESTTGLDVSRQRKVIDSFKNIHEMNPQLTMIFISHDFGFLSHVVEEYYVLYGGFICEHITDEKQFLDIDKLHPYTQDLISSIVPNKSELNVEELSANVDLSKHLIGCPYVKKCKHVTQNNLFEKCNNEIPYVSKDVSFDLDKPWKRCWINDE